MHDSAVNEGELAMFDDKNLLFISSASFVHDICNTGEIISVYVKNL